MLSQLACPAGGNKGRGQPVGCLHPPHGCSPAQALLSTRARCAPLPDPHVAGALLPACRLHLPGSPRHALQRAPARIILL